LEPKSIEQIGSELAIQWSDEAKPFFRCFEERLPLRGLRGEPDDGGCRPTK
jgi:hypothetical protein